MKIKRATPRFDQASLEERIKEDGFDCFISVLLHCKALVVPAEVCNL